MLDNIHVYLFNMKEPAYNMKLMSTYGDLTSASDQEKQGGILKMNPEIFNKEISITPLFFSNHFKFRYSIDDHNNLRHSVLSLEETWITHRWINCVFSFILAITEINAYLALKFFVWIPWNQKIPTLRKFWRKLAFDLIYDEFHEKEEDTPLKAKKKLRLVQHELLTAPPHAKRFCAEKNGTSRHISSTNNTLVNSLDAHKEFVRTAYVIRERGCVNLSL